MGVVVVAGCGKVVAIVVDAGVGGKTVAFSTLAALIDDTTADADSDEFFDGSGGGEDGLLTEAAATDTAATTMAVEVRLVLLVLLLLLVVSKGVRVDVAEAADDTDAGTTSVTGVLELLLLLRQTCMLPPLVDVFENTNS
jgi:hypothetical protein